MMTNMHGRMCCNELHYIMCGICSGLLNIICSLQSIHTSVAEGGRVGARGGGPCTEKDGVCVGHED